MSDDPPVLAPKAQHGGVDREFILVLLISALFTLPLWLGAHPPMADYPQHLSMASILRWYHDPARHLVENYTFAFSRPNTAFVLLTAGLATLVPLTIAGKLVIALAITSTGLAGFALARHAGRPGWYGLFALLASYSYAFFFGFANYLIAIPLFIYGIVLADRTFERPETTRSRLVLAAFAALLYFVHMQVQVLFVAIGLGLALVHRPRPRVFLKRALLFVPALGLAAFHFVTRHPEAFRYRERRMYSAPTSFDITWERVTAIPRYSFGDDVDNVHWVIFGLAMLSIMLLIRARSSRGDGGQTVAPPSDDFRTRLDSLRRHRFGVIAGSIFLCYLCVPGVFIGAYMYQRLMALVWYILPAIVHRSEKGQQRPAKFALAAALLVQLLLVSLRAHSIGEESRQGFEIIDRAAPGKNLMSLIMYDQREKVDSPPLFQHFAAYYVAAKGGRINSSFTELHISPVQLRRGLDFEDLHATVPEWFPQFFRFDAFGYHFDYFLFHGDPAKLAPIFGASMDKMDREVRGPWVLLWRKPVVR